MPSSKLNKRRKPMIGTGNAPAVVVAGAPTGHMACKDGCNDIAVMSVLHTHPQS